MDTVGKRADVKTFCIKFCKHVVLFSRKGSFLANCENTRLIRAVLRIFFFLHV